MLSKPYPRATETFEPPPDRLRLIDTNILIDALFESQTRHDVVFPWFGRLLNIAHSECILIPDSVHDEYMWVAQNKPVLGGVPVSAEHAIGLFEDVLGHPSVRLVANARPSPQQIHRAILQTRVSQQRKITADLRIAFTALQHGAVVCTANAKDFGAISEVLRMLKFYDPALFQ